MMGSQDEDPCLYLKLLSQALYLQEYPKKRLRFDRCPEWFITGPTTSRKAERGISRVKTKVCARTWSVCTVDSVDDYRSTSAEQLRS